MTFDTSEKTNHNATIVVNNEFYVRAIAAWLLLLVPGFLMALVFGRWLHYLVVAPLVISPLTIWAYDLSQFLRKPGARSKKLLLLSLIGFGLALFFSYMAVQVNTGQSASTPVSSVAPTLVEPTEAADNNFQSVQQLQPVDALERAKQLGEQASQMVKEPPYPPLVWESAQQKWEQAVQYLKSIPLDAEIYEEASVKLAAYQINQSAIAERIETENNAATNYRLGRSLVDELIVLTEPIGRIETKDLPMLKQVDEKLMTAIKTFKSIPSGTAVSELAQEQIDSHSKDYQNLKSIIKVLETCDSKGILDCKVNQSVRVLVD